MSRNKLYIIPLFLIEMIIQLGFFWLAPECDCTWVVYAFLTIATTLHLVLSFLITTRFGIRRAAASVVAGTFIQLLIITSSIYLLAMNASARNATFLILILVSLYATVTALFGFSIEGFIRNGGDPAERQPEMDETDSNRTGCSVPGHSRSEHQRYESNASVRSRRNTPPPLPVKR